MSADQDRIKDLAYRLWQEGGSAHGRDMDYWLMAEAQLAQPSKAAAKPEQAAKAKAPAKAPAKAKAPVKAKAPAKV
jgi:hypothetical protein